MSNRYIDFNLIDKYPNKYKITPEKIKKLKILDWGKLKERTWHNNAMLSGNWWCHLEGSQKEGQPYNDEDDEFWIGFNEDNDKIEYDFTSYGGLCLYKFRKFYDGNTIENKYDMQVQANTIRWLNMMIDDGVLGI